MFLRFRLTAVGALLCFTLALKAAPMGEAGSLISDQGSFFYGFDDVGHSVFYQPLCNSSATCYYTFFNGVSTGTVYAAPTLNYDNGVSCSPATNIVGLNVRRGSCNGSHEVYTGDLPMSDPTLPTSARAGVFVGPNLTDKIYSGGEGLLYVNSRGDVILDDVFTDSWYEVYGTAALAPTPEPSSIVLLGTSLMVFAAFGRRRFTGSARSR